MALRKEDMDAPHYFATDIGISFKHSGMALIVNTDVPSIQRPGDPPQNLNSSHRACHVWMSPEHLKLFAFILVRSLQQYQKDTQWDIPVMRPVLEQVGATPEEWQSFWSVPEPQQVVEESAHENNVSGQDAQPAAPQPQGIVGGNVTTPQ